MITLKDIAKSCNVSVATVSNVLNEKKNVSEETRRRVMAVVNETGFQPNYIAQGLRKQKTQTVEIIAEDISLSSTSRMIESITEYCEEKKYKVTLQNMRLYARWGESWYKQEEIYHSVFDPILQSVKADGIIYLAGHGRIIKCFPEDFDIPAVIAFSYSDSVKVPSVVLDDVQGSYEMTKYLIGMGHKKIGLIGGRRDNLHTQDRILGYQKALHEEKILYDPELVRCGAWGRETGYIEMENLAGQGVTAVFCMADTMAGGVCDFCRENGIEFGKDISVAGFNNQELSEYFNPRLSTVDRNLPVIGHRAARILIDKIENGNSKEEDGTKIVVRCPCSLVIRNSVMKIN